MSTPGIEHEIADLVDKKSLRKSVVAGSIGATVDAAESNAATNESRDHVSHP